MKTAFTALLLGTLASRGEASTYKLACLWNDTDQAVKVELEWDSLDPYTVSIPAGGSFGYYWTQASEANRTPPLQLWYQQTTAADTLTTESLVLVPQFIAVPKCYSYAARQLPIHYEIKQAPVEGGGYTFNLQGPKVDP